MKKIPPFKRLYENIIVSERECWEWQGQTGSSGYGQIKKFGKLVSCHRFSYELYKGNIPSNLEVMHSCNNRICVNPDHLTVGTHGKNMSDASKNNACRNVKRSGVKGVHKSQSKQVIVLGKAYGSINEAERELKLSSGLVSYWIKSKSNKVKVISREEYFAITGE